MSELAQVVGDPPAITAAQRWYLISKASEVIAAAWKIEYPDRPINDAWRVFMMRAAHGIAAWIDEERLADAKLERRDE